MAASALFLVPAGVTLPRTKALPSWSADAVTGERFRSLCNDNVLVLGPDGIGCETPEGTVTVRWTDAVAVLAWHDGSRIVMSRDGFRVAILPDEWTDGARAVGLLDTWGPAAVVPMGAHGPPPDPPRETEPPDRRPWIWLAAGWVVTIGLFAYATVTNDEEPFGRADSVAALGIVFFLGLVARTITLLTRLQERQPRD